MDIVNTNTMTLRIQVAFSFNLFLCGSMSFIKIRPIIWQWNFTNHKGISFIICMAFFPQGQKRKQLVDIKINK